MTADLAARDLVHMALGRGRDNAASLSEIAERLHLTRRQCEQAVQTLRLEGIAVASGSDGVWLTDDLVDMQATYRSLRGRIESQVVTAWAVRRVVRRLANEKVQQLPLFGEAA